MKDESKAAIESLLADARRSTHAVASRFASPAALQRVLELYARQIMNRVGVTMVDYQIGIRFARSLSRPFRLYHGPALARELERHWDHWSGLGMERGLTLSVLEAIRTQVFNIGAPVGP